MRAAGLLLCAGALASVPASAETLGQAIADAYRFNPRLESQRAQLRELDEGVIQAASPYRLNVSVIGSLSYDYQRQRVLGEFQSFDQKMLGAALTVTQLLSNGGRTAAQISAAEADVLAGREVLRQAENAILFEVVDSYVSVRRDVEVLAIQQRSVESYSRQVDQARARERAGDLTRTDIAQAQAQLLIQQTQVEQTKAQLQADRGRFAIAVGRNPGNLEPEPPLPGLPASIGSAYQIAEQESPVLWQAILNERAGKSRVAAERAERNPIISASGRYGYNSPFSYGTRDLGRAASGVVTVTVPLINQGITGSRIRQAIANQQSLTFLVEDARRSVDLQLLNAWNQSITSQINLVNGQQGVAIAETALQGVRRGFSEGFRSNFEVLDSEQRLLNTQLIVASARYQQYSNQANLLATLGRLQAAAVEEAVSVYNSAENLRHVRAIQISPFTPIVKAIDSVQKPSERNRAAPVVNPASAPVIAAAAVPPPQGPLADDMPLTANARPPLPEDRSPPQLPGTAGPPRSPK